MNRTHRPLHTIRQDLESVLAGQQSLDPLPPLSDYEKQIAALRDKLDMATDEEHAEAIRDNLRAAHLSLEELRTAIRKRGLIDEQVNTLRTEMAEAEEAERMARIGDQNRALSAAVDEFRSLSIAAAKAYRALLNENRVSANTPGCQSLRNDDRIWRFDIGFLMPMSYQGTLSETMRAGRAPFEQVLTASERGSSYENDERKVA
jgi:hypothetical protein